MRHGQNDSGASITLSSSPVNFEFMREITGEDDSFLREFALTFLSDVETRGPEVKKAVDYFDGRKLRDAAHSFAGSATCMGADELYRLTQELEKAAMSGSQPTSQVAYQAFVDELTRVVDCLREFLERTGG